MRLWRLILGSSGKAAEPEEKVEAGAHEYAILYRSRSMVEDLDDRTPARGLDSERDLSWALQGSAEVPSHPLCLLE